MNTVYLSRKKQFAKGDWRQIFQGESQCDSIQFLIERGFFDGLTTEDIQCLAQIFLPHTRSCKFYPLFLEEELYDNRHRMILPISSELTRKAGTVEIVFTFYNSEQRIKTDSFKFEVFPSASGDNMLDDGGTDELDLLEGLREAITQLDSRIAKLEEYFNSDENAENESSGD